MKTPFLENIEAGESIRARALIGCAEATAQTNGEKAEARDPIGALGDLPDSARQIEEYKYRENSPYDRSNRLKRKHLT